MADVSQIKLPNGDTYNLVDETSGYIKNYTETDPVFSASAAAGITSTDISNWNGKSDTDEKVKSEVVSTANKYYLVFSDSNSTSTSILNKTPGLSVSVPNSNAADGNTRLILGETNGRWGSLQLFSTNQYGVILQPTYTSFTGHRNVYLPDKDGTIALTSDIPRIYSSTNTNGYLTMATLPIYDGTVE